MKRLFIKLVSTWLILLIVTLSYAKEPLHERYAEQANQRLLGIDQDNLFGNWQDNPWFKNYGISPSLVWISDIQGNPIGGITRGLREFNNLFITFTVDLKQTFNLENTTLFASMSQRSGSSLTNNNIGNLFNVTQVCCGATFRMVDFYLEHSFADDYFNLRVGRIATGDEFLSSPLYWLFVQNGIDGNPVGIFRNSPGMSAYPKATWGIRSRLKPSDDTYWMTGFYNGDRSLGENQKHGFDWSLRGPLFAITEIGYRPNQQQDSPGLPGNYKMGFYYDNNEYNEYIFDINATLAPITMLPPRTRRGNYGLYFLVDQMIYRPDPTNRERGLTPFFSLLLSPQKAISNMPFFINGGLVYHGPMKTRPKDIAGLAVVYGRLSSDLRTQQRLESQLSGITNIQTHELVFEGMYLIQVTPWLKVQPDIQYIIRPGATGQIPNALVLGAQLGVTF